jgi:hypothetical protein
MTIRNPLLKDGAWCSATVYGFEATHTGGGCIAYRLDLPNGDQLLLTDEDGSALPDDPLDAVDAILGRYNEGGEPIAYVRVGDIPLAVAEAVDAIPAGEGPDEEQWIEFSHGDQRWSFSSCELAQWDDEDEAFHFNAFHGLSEPTVDAVKAFIDQV